MLRGFAVLPLFLMSAGLLAQDAPKFPEPGQLDPTRAITSPVLFSSFHQLVPEQYIWTTDDLASKGGPAHRNDERFFRARFNVTAPVQHATLYVAGPASVEARLNGAVVGHFAADPLSRLDMHVFQADVSQALHPGDNSLVLDVRGGDQLVAKIVPAPPDIAAAPILVSDASWQGILPTADQVKKAGFGESSWPAVEARGSIEGNIDFFQWGGDAGLYDWPGYAGSSPFLAHAWLNAERVQNVYAGGGSFENIDSLTGKSQGTEFTVHLDPNRPAGEYTPGITLDFGREVSGRVQVVSDSDAAATVSIAYGESLGELNNEPYLGMEVLHLAPHGTGAASKSAFRYARIRFLQGPHTLAFQSIRLENIYYPVHYLGAFESSDPLLNRIWETGVYTSHLCMQDDIWDATKRDRGRWMGDTDVSGRVIDAVFADHFLVEDTLTRLIGPVPIKGHVNGIPGYSSYWFTELADYVRHTGRKEYVASVHDQLEQLLEFMDKDFDAQNQFINHTKQWLYVDWANGLNGDTPETHKATTLEYVRAYRDGAWLLQQIGDMQNAEHWEQRASEITKSSQATAFADGSFGPRWQTNAMAVISGVASPDQYASIWGNVLGNVGKPTYRPDIVSPYYGSYVLDAMAEMDHRDAALAWIREYWGGMIAEGATSFWEAYDPAWPKDDPHVDLQADDTAGYQTSLAHGWASGPSYWLMEQVLGIQPTAPGFAKTTIRPDLVDLTWARGAEPTPQGLLKVDLSHSHAEHSLHLVIDLPAGVEATVLYPAAPGVGPVLVNGARHASTTAENGTRLALVLDQAGHYEIHAD
jgi:alpha-L-rhamnosidase